MNATPTTRLTSLVNTTIIVDVIRPVSIMLVIVLNHSIFLPAFHKLEFHQENIPKFQLITSSNVCRSCGAVDLDLGIL